MEPQARGEDTLGRLTMDAGIAEAKAPSKDSPFTQWVSRFEEIVPKASLLDRKLIMSAKIGLNAANLK